MVGCRSLQKFLKVWLVLSLTVMSPIRIVADTEVEPETRAGSEEAAEAGSGIESLYASLAANPFDREVATEFLRAVRVQRDSLGESDIGRSWLRRAKHVQLINALKKKFDECFGGDIFELEAAQRVLLGAAQGQLNHDCDFSDSALDEIDEFADDLDVAAFEDFEDQNSESLLNLRRTLFENTAIQAAAAEARLRHLISDEAEAETLLQSICGEGLSGCPNEFVSRFRQRQQEQVSELNASGHDPRSASQISEMLNGQLEGIYEQVYSPERTYHRSQTEAEMWEASGLGDEDPALLMRQPTGPEMMTFTPVENFNTNRELTREQILENYDRTQAALTAAIPMSVFHDLDELRANPYGQILATSTEWARTLGHGSTIAPTEMVFAGRSGYRIGPVGIDRSGGQEFMSVGSQLSLIDEQSILENRDQSLRRLNSTIGEMGRRVFGSDRGNGVSDDIQNLLVANPMAAGQELLNSPRLYKAYCQMFREIRRDDRRDRFITWGLVGLTIGVAIFTGGASLLGAPALVTAGGTAMAVVGAADVLYGTSQGIEDMELSRIQQSVCIAEGAESEACSEYEESRRRANLAFGLAGLGAASMIPFTRIMARLSRGSPELYAQAAENADEAARFLRTEQGQVLLRGLPESEQGALLAHLSFLSPEELRNLNRYMAGLSREQRQLFQQHLMADLASGEEMTGIVSRLDQSYLQPRLVIEASPNPSGAGTEGYLEALTELEPPVAQINRNRPPGIDRMTSPGQSPVSAGPPDAAEYDRWMRQYMDILEEQGYETVRISSRSGSPRAHDIVCIEGGPRTSVLGRIASSANIGGRGQGVAVCLDPYLSSSSGQWEAGQEVIALSWNSFNHALHGRGYVLLHEAGHATQLRRAVRPGGNPFMPHGRMGQVVDTSLYDDMAWENGEFYFPNGYTFDEFHSFDRNLRQYMAALRRGESPEVAPSTISYYMNVHRNNLIAANRYGERVQDIFTRAIESRTLVSDAYSVTRSIEPTQINGQMYNLEFLDIAYPVTNEAGEVIGQQTGRILIPPGEGQFMDRAAAEVTRLQTRTVELYEDSLRMEFQFRSLLPLGSF